MKLISSEVERGKGEKGRKGGEGGRVRNEGWELGGRLLGSLTRE